jgi:GT2 family glycosyltransferase
VNPPIVQNHPADRPTNPELAVVIVNYNGWPDVVRLVLTLIESPEVAQGRCEIIVVDNASDGPLPDEFLNERPGLRLVLRVENGGFAAGVNAGWQSTRAGWLLLLHPDVVAGADLIGRVMARLSHDRASSDGPPGVVGFGLRNQDGTRQPSVGVDPNLWRSLRGLFIPRPRRKYQPAWRTKAGEVPWVTGACALVDAALLQTLGGMDDDFFLYYEEVALCRSARALGRRVEYDPSLDVVHLRPLQDRPVSPTLRIITRHSKLLYFRKHLPYWQFVGLSWVVAVESVARGAWANWRGGAAEARAWWTIGRLTRALRRGEPILGRAVLTLAEASVGHANGLRWEPGTAHPGPHAVQKSSARPPRFRRSGQSGR